MKNKKWVLSPSKLTNDEIEKLATNTGLSLPIVKLLSDRGYDTKNKIEKFLNFTSKDITDVLKMKDGKQAISRMMLAVKNKEHILIYGDYDMDGIAATSIMKNTFESLGCQVSYYINDRITNGFGLCLNGFNDAKEKFPKFSLLITVDNGVDRIEEVKHIMNEGIDVIVTDHHEPLPSGEIPHACAVVNAHRLDEEAVTFKYLCGAGLAYKLCAELYRSIKDIPDNITLLHDEIMMHNLGLASLATICDMVELVDENRYIVKKGIEAIKNSNRRCWTVLRKKLNKQVIDEKTFGFSFGPMFNALSRMGKDPAIGVKFFTSDNENELELLIDEMIKNNTDRVELCDRLRATARLDLEINANKQKNVKVLYGDYHEGVAGIIASDILEQTQLPTIVLCKSNHHDGLYKGSARSIKNINIKEVLDQCSEFLESYGGHAAAAGLSLKEENISGFIEKINSIIKTESLDITENIDLLLKPQDLTFKFVHEYKTLLTPFGQGFRDPIFCLRGTITKVQLLANKHLKLILNNNIEVIWWKKGDRLKEFSEGQSIKVFGRPEINNYKPNTVQFIVNDIEIWDIEKLGLQFKNDDLFGRYIKK